MTHLLLPIRRLYGRIAQRNCIRAIERGDPDAAEYWAKRVYDKEALRKAIKDTLKRVYEEVTGHAFKG